MEAAPYYVNLYRKTPYMLNANQDVPECTYGEAGQFIKYIPNTTESKIIVVPRSGWE